MPLYYFTCPLCSSTAKKIYDTEAEAIAKIKPCKCGGKMVRSPRPFTSKAVETIDNGFMVKKVERLVDAARIYRERAEADNKPNDD